MVSMAKVNEDAFQKGSHAGDGCPSFVLVAMHLKVDNHTFKKKGLIDMGKFRKSILNRRMGHWVLLLIILGSPSMVLGMETGTDEKIETIKSALIKDKGDYGILIKTQRYIVNESTLIFDLLGKEIPLCDLPVPCEALVEYKNINGVDLVCLRIEMRRLLEDSKDKE